MTPVREAATERGVHSMQRTSRARTASGRTNPDCGESASSSERSQAHKSVSLHFPITNEVTNILTASNSVLYSFSLTDTNVDEGEEER